MEAVAIVVLAVSALFFSDLVAIQSVNNLFRPSNLGGNLAESSALERRAEFLSVIVRLGMTDLLYRIFYGWLNSFELLNTVWAKTIAFFFFYIALVFIGTTFTGSISFKELFLRSGAHVGVFFSLIGVLILMLLIVTVSWGRNLLLPILEFLLTV